MTPAFWNFPKVVWCILLQVNFRWQNFEEPQQKFHRQGAEAKCPVSRFISWHGFWNSCHLRPEPQLSQTHLDVGNAFPSMKHLEIATQLITETFIPWAKPAAALPSTNSFKDLRLVGKLWRFNHRPRNGVLDKFCVYIFLHPNFPFWYSLNISSWFLKQTYTSNQFRDLSANNILTLRFWGPATIVTDTSKARSKCPQPCASSPPGIGRALLTVVQLSYYAWLQVISSWLSIQARFEPPTAALS